MIESLFFQKMEEAHHQTLQLPVYTMPYTLSLMLAFPAILVRAV